MSTFIISREKEIKILEQCLVSKSPEFLAIYGRRRIGKTFLVKQFFKEKKVVFFCATGEKDAAMKKQIRHFTAQISRVFYNGINLEASKNWDKTLELLTKAIDSSDKNKKIVLFFDEFPWMVTRNSNLLQDLDYYWNQHWSDNNRVKLIICGSSASWIIDNIVNNKGGLHNRLTHSIYLESLKLRETKIFLKAKGVSLNNRQIVDLYMSMGGVPYYLNRVEKGMSVTEVIELLAFKRKGFLMEEFDNLFASLFKDPKIFIEIIKIIASHRYGIGQRELLEHFGKKLVGKGGLEKLKVLKEAGFIVDFKPLFHKDKGIYYKLIDNYSLFYLYWIEPIRESLIKKSLLKGYWDKIKTKASWHSWAGLAFETICYEHLPQITRSLGLSPTAIPSVWRYVPRKDGGIEQGAQIDLLFDRYDDAITICEIKYSDKPFVITRDYAEKLKNKVEIFKKVTRTSKQLFIVLISANGVKKNKYSDELISTVVVLDDFFN